MEHAKKLFIQSIYDIPADMTGSLEEVKRKTIPNQYKHEVHVRNIQELSFYFTASTPPP
jgi:hypothetical protein